MEKLKYDILLLDYKIETNLKSACKSQYLMIQKKERLAKLEKSYQSSKKDAN